MVYHPLARRRHPIAAHGVYLGAFDLTVKRLRGGAGRAALPPAPPNHVTMVYPTSPPNHVTRW